MTTLDRALISIDRRPLDAVLRALLGFVCIPLLSLLHQDVRSGWILTIGLLLLMLSLRIAPVFARKLLPLSPEVKAVWAERRQLAKRYDSFQWQKLVFIGVGLASYMLVSRELLTSTIAVSSFCVLFGTIGLIRWYTQAHKVRSSIVNKGVL
jgi:hypothetical protein